jgi:hypothetical protein
MLPWLVACRPQTAKEQAVARYAFSDARFYTLDFTLNSSNRLIKTHRAKVFSNRFEQRQSRQSYALQTLVMPDGTLQAHFYLESMRVIGRQGQFEFFWQPGHGHVVWYGKRQALADYLSSNELQELEANLRRPLARLWLDQQGRSRNEAALGDANWVFRTEAFSVLNKNRVIMQGIQPALRLPPVFMVVFPHEALVQGSRWEQAGQNAQRFQEWDEPIRTEYRVRRLDRSTMLLGIRTRTEFQGPELTALSKRLGLDRSGSIVFERSFFEQSGEMDFQIRYNRPASGKLRSHRYYRLKNQEEIWEQDEEETFGFRLFPLSARRTQ